MSLLRLPAGASTFASPPHERRVRARIGLVVVLPFDPATAISIGENWERQCCASWHSANRVSSTTISGMDDADWTDDLSNPASTIAATAPERADDSTKAWPSYFSPRNA